MLIFMGRKRWFLALALLAVVMAALGTLRGWWAGTSRAASQGEANDAASPKNFGKVLPAASRLRIQVAESKASAKKLIDLDYKGWDKAKPTAIVLSRSPRIYQTEPALTRSIPACQVRALRAAKSIYLRIRWDDATKNAPRAAHPRTSEAKHLPRRPTEHTSAFADAAAVMVPKNWTGPRFPSLLMGDKKAPADLYYWNASRGADKLTASGRATPQPVGQSFPYRARHDGTAWVLTLAIPDVQDGYPVAFAFWDGQHGDRDGLKFFSVWYVLTPE
jgi:DMSO reductase family type II enzyme heme b subunit